MTRLLPLPLPLCCLSAAADGDGAMMASCVTCDLDYYVVEYVMKSQRRGVSSIEQAFGVTIKSVQRVCDEIVSVAFQRSAPSSCSVYLFMLCKTF